MKRILLTGGSGMIGSSIRRTLAPRSDIRVEAPDSKELNLLDSGCVNEWFSKFQPDFVIHAAARVGGIGSNMRYPASFSLENLTMQSNLLNGLVKFGIKKVINLSSACIYPKRAQLPLHPSSLFSGPLEESNRWYANAKLSMISALEAVKIQHGIDSISILPANVYGPNDNFNEADGHVVASLLFRADKLKSGETFLVWGSGNPKRELIYVDDLARAIENLLDNFEVAPRVLNVGSGEELSIEEIASEVLSAVGKTNKTKFDLQRPDGIPRKPVDSTAIRNLGWSPLIDFATGIRLTYDWLVRNRNGLRTKGVSEFDSK